MRTFCFSRTHGNKTNTFEKEPKQGASTTADLLKQKSQEEVLESKPSTAASDEEKLAAGISTMGLQAKGLSGAQRKKLVIERKMQEGTWTAENPKRKAPPSQDKGTAESSGGVKRPHSDSSTPSQEKQQPKKPRCRLEHTRKLLFESRWRLSISTILMFAWISLRQT